MLFYLSEFSPSISHFSNCPVVHTVFDFLESEKSLQGVDSVRDEIQLENNLTNKVISLTPSQLEHNGLEDLTTKVKDCISKFISQKLQFGNATIVSCHEIGSFKMGTMLSGHSTSDLMCTFTGPISVAQLDSVAEKILEEFLFQFPTESFQKVKIEDTYNIEISTSSYKIRLWPVSERTSGFDQTVHISRNVLAFNKVAIKHTSWFIEHGSNNDVLALARLLKELRNIFDGFKPLTAWLICLLAHYSVRKLPDRKNITLYAAFRRCLKSLASGMLLSNSIGILDPCESGNTRTHIIMTVAEQDTVCLTAQYLVRVGSRIGYDKIFEVEGLSTGLAKGPGGYIIKQDKPVQKSHGRSEKSQRVEES